MVLHSSINDLVAVPLGSPPITAKTVIVLYVRVRLDGFHEEDAVWSPAMISCPDMVGLFNLLLHVMICVPHCNFAVPSQSPRPVLRGLSSA